MPAVFSSSLPKSNYAPKSQASKRFQPIGIPYSKPDAAQSGAPKFPNSNTQAEGSTTTKPAANKWKRSTLEDAVDSPPAKRAPAESLSPIPEEPPKNSEKNGKTCYTRETREKYLREKAATVEMPTAEAAELSPKYLYDDPTLIVHMCLDCRIASRKLEMKKVDDVNQQLAVNLCNICRAAVKTQRGVKFFQHDLLCLKRRLENGK